MNTRKVLFISGSLGLGHITRDVEIAHQLRKICPEAEIRWLASGTAAAVLKSAREELVQEASSYADENDDAEKAAKGRNVNLFAYLMKARHSWKSNARLFSEIVSRLKPDLVIGDETYEIILELRKNPGLKKWPFVMIFDFMGLDPMTRNPVEHLGVYAYNYMWSADYRKASAADLTLFVGEPGDVPDRRFGFMLPNRREYAMDRGCNFVGFIVPSDPDKYSDSLVVKKRLGYGTEPLIICSIGGTSIGKQMLELCGQSLPIVRQSQPQARMILVCGPRLDPKSLVVPDGVETVGYLPALYEHFAASDLSVVQGGGTTTLELTVLRRPFIYFPIEGHSEQKVVAARLARHQAGFRMDFAKTSPDDLAAAILKGLNSNVEYPVVRPDGALKSANLIRQLIK